MKETQNSSEVLVGSSDDWQSKLNKLIVTNILRHQEARGLTSPQLAARCAKVAGITFGESIIDAITVDGEHVVSIPQLLVLASAMQMAPIELIVPVGLESTITILPGLDVDVADALRLLCGEPADVRRIADGPNRQSFCQRVSELRVGQSLALEYVRKHAGILDRLWMLHVTAFAFGTSPSLDEEILEWFDDLRHLRERMDTAGVPRPPLVAALQFVDQRRAVASDVPIRGFATEEAIANARKRRA